MSPPVRLPLSVYSIEDRVPQELGKEQLSGVLAYDAERLLYTQAITD
jgi:hypothetical protein